MCQQGRFFLSHRAKRDGSFWHITLSLLSYITLYQPFFGRFPFSLMFLYYHTHRYFRICNILVRGHLKIRCPVLTEMDSSYSVTAQMLIDRRFSVIGYHQLAVLICKKCIVPRSVFSRHRVKCENGLPPDSVSLSPRQRLLQISFTSANFGGLRGSGNLEIAIAEHAEANRTVSSSLIPLRSA